MAMRHDGNEDADAASTPMSMRLRRAASRPSICPEQPVELALDRIHADSAIDGARVEADQNCDREVSPAPMSLPTPSR